MNTITSPQNNDTLKKEVLERIVREEITPVSKTLFALKNILFWTLWILTMLLGALAVAVLIFTELNIGWEFYEMTHKNALTFFAHSLPYLWILLLGAVVILGIYNLRHTKTGYRYSLVVVVLVGVCGSVLGGVVLHSYGMGKVLDEGFGKFMPMYVPVRSEREGFWRQPERGLYTGTITALDNEQMVMTLVSTDGITHVLSTAYVPQTQLSEIEVNTRVRIMATSSDEDESIFVCRIHEWEDDEALTFGDMHERRQMFRDVFENIEERIEGEVPEVTPCTPLKQGGGMKMNRPPMPVLPPEIN